MRSSSKVGRPARSFVAAPLAALAVMVVAATAAAQDRTVADHEWCQGHDRRDGESVCEVQEWIYGATSDLNVNAKPNGGVSVAAWDRDEIQVLAKVHGWADSESRARAIVDEIDVKTGGKVSADGPESEQDEGWSVSYRVMVPSSTNLDLSSTNGGIKIEGVSGKLRFHTTNGGVHLEGIGGDVEGGTTNGGLHIALDGSGWDGEGLDVRTINGGVTMSMPAGYSAHLEAATTNGGLHIGFPVTVQGQIDRKLSVDLGDGGPTVRVTTTNGGVKIEQS